MIIGGIIKEAIGPLPKICQESVLRDLECARMSAEDLRAKALSPEVSPPWVLPKCYMTWREVADNEVRYASVLDQYWQRAEAQIRRADELYRLEEERLETTAHMHRGSYTEIALMNRVNALAAARRVLNGGIVANPLIEDEEVEVVTEDEEVAEDASMTDRDD